ncbi:NHL repeat-containing protein 3 isoform X2 [Hyperolius riggenbachi]|uniref:NHL repeat-containing protein 3 isoform X2 n=1 Tax=Hyperolius riggenbachi TaxID=752182 RepID=UPI0035A2B4CB
MQFKYSVCLSGILVSLAVLLLYSYDNPELWVKVILEYLSEPRNIQLFRLDAGWPRDPDHFTGVPFDIAVDYQSSLVYVAQRGDNVSKVLVFTEEGVFKDSWNTDTLEMPHGIFAAITPQEQSLWITDVGQGSFGHTVKQYTMSGKLIKVLGTAGLAGSGLSPLQFDQPADVFVKPNGDMYVVDGDGGLNNRLLMLNKDFNVQWTLGGNGTQPGKFYIPHSVEVDEFGRVWVADRGNKRIQVFDSVTGEWIGTWDTCFSEDGPYSVRITADRKYIVVAQLNISRLLFLSFPSIGHIGKCKVISSIQMADGVRPHLVDVSSMTGAVYVAELGAQQVQKYIYVETELDYND